MRPRPPKNLPTWAVWSIFAPLALLSPMIAPAVPKFHASTMMLASGLWISDMTVAVIADTDKPAISVANTGRSGAAWRSITRMVIARGRLVMTSVEKQRNRLAPAHK